MHCIMQPNTYIIQVTAAEGSKNFTYLYDEL